MLQKQHLDIHTQTTPPLTSSRSVSAEVKLTLREWQMYGNLHDNLQYTLRNLNHYRMCCHVGLQPFTI